MPGVRVAPPGCVPHARVPGVRVAPHRVGAARASARRFRAGHRDPTRTAQAALAFVAYMSTYSWPESRITSDITESVTARST